MRKERRMARSEQAEIQRRVVVDHQIYLLPMFQCAKVDSLLRHIAFRGKKWMRFNTLHFLIVPLFAFFVLENSPQNKLSVKSE